VRTVIAMFAIVVLVGTPLLIFDELRLDLAHRFGLAPGREAELLVDGDEGAVLVILPLGEYDGVGRERYAYEAAYIARPVDSGMILTDIETNATLEIPLAEIPFIAANGDGSTILFRGPLANEPNSEREVVVHRADGDMDVLPEGQLAPDEPGDWETETWRKVTSTCDRISPNHRYIACFNRAELVNYFAGNWQVDVQVYGDFRISEPVYRGLGFWPTLGFAHDDQWLYFQNERGIYRVEIPESLQQHQPSSTPQATAHGS
jgi:hypothetical protein